MTLGWSTEYYEGALKVLLLSMFIYQTPTHLACHEKSLYEQGMNLCQRCFLDFMIVSSIKMSIDISENLSIAKQCWPNLIPKFSKPPNL